MFMPYPPSYFEFIQLFNERHFFEAHEVLESLWREEKGSDRDFFQGLIQKNLSGADRLMKTASAYLQPYAPSHYGIQVHSILEQAESALAAAKADRDMPFYLIKINEGS